MSILQLHPNTEPSPFYRRWPLLGLATPLLVLLFAAAAIWAGTTPAGAQDGYEPDEQLIDDVRGYSQETEKGHDHVLRWMRVLHTFDALDDVTAAEAQDYADNGWERWDPVADALADLEDAPGDYQPDGQLISDVRGYARETEKGYDHVLRWMRVLHTFGALEDMTAAEAQRYADNGWQRWEPVAAELAELEASTADPEPTPTPTPTPEPTPTATPDPNRAPVVNTQAKHYAAFIGKNNAPRGFLVSKPFHGIFSDPDGDKLTYSVSVPADQLRLVDEVLVPTEEQMEQSGHPIEVIQRVFFRGEAEADWKTITPPVPDRPVVTATLTATDPGGRSASVQGDFLVWWDSYPEVVIAVASASVIELTFDWAVEDDPGPKAGQFTVHVVNGDGSSRTVAVSSVSVSGKVVRLGLASALAAGQTVTVDYAYDYQGDTPLQRAGGGDAAPGFTGQAVTVSLPLSEPQNFALDAEPGRKALLATWDAVEGATSYKLRWRETGGEFEADNAVTVSNAIWAITVSDYGRWEMRLQACNAAGCGPEASRSADVVQAASLRLERAVDADGNARPRTITATWDPVEGAASYTLRWQRIGADSQAQAQPDGAGDQGANAQGENRLNLPADRTGVDFTVPDGGAYQVNLQARNDGNELIAQTDTHVNQAPGQPDTTPPWLVRGEIDGNRVTFYFSEPLDEHSVGGYYRVALHPSLKGNTTFTVGGPGGQVAISGNTVMVGLGSSKWERVSVGGSASTYYAMPLDSTAEELRDLAGNAVWTPYKVEQEGIGGHRRTRIITLTNLTMPPPAVSEVAMTSTPAEGETYALGETLRVTVTFTEAVDVDTTMGTPRLKIKMDPGWGEFWAHYESGSGTKALEFAYTVAEPNTSPQGIAVLADTLELNGGAIRSAATDTDAHLWHGGLSHDPDHMVDWRVSEPGAPTVTAVTVSSNAGSDNTYNLGDAIRVTLNFSEAVDATGTPRLKIKMDPKWSEFWANYESGSGTNGLTFAYQVAEPNTAPQGIAVLANTLEHGNGAIQSAADQRVAHLRHEGLGHDWKHRVDGRIPALLGVAVTGKAVSLTFGEALDENSVPSASAFTVKRTPQGGAEETVGLSGPPTIAAGAVVLTLTDPVLETDAGVKVSYAMPAPGVGNRLQDQAGNDAESFTDQAADAIDTTQPRLERGEIDGDVVTLYFSEPLDESSGGEGDYFRVTTQCGGCDHNCTATFTTQPREVYVSGNMVVVVGLKENKRARVDGYLTNRMTYVADTTATNRLRDLAGNPVWTPVYRFGDLWDTQEIALDNVTGLPWPERAMVVGNRLTLTLSAPLDGGSRPAASAFTVKVNGSAVSLARANPVAVSGHTVAVSLASPVAAGDTATVSYDKSDGKPIQNVVCEDAASFSDVSATNFTGVSPVAGVAITSDPGDDDTYGLGDTIRATLTFSEAVTVTGAPRLGIDLDPDGGSEKWMRYESGSGTASLTFAYKVRGGNLVLQPDRSARGVAVLANTLDPDGGVIHYKSSGDPAYLAHAGLAHDPNHQVDWRR